MSLESNKALLRRVFEELINQEKKELIDELFAPDIVVHDPFIGTASGVEAYKGLLGMFDAAFPHHRVQIDNIFADGDYVIVHHTHLATNTGSFMGAPPTGKTVKVNGLELFRVAEGKITEFWRKDDDVSLLMQLGILPAPQMA